KYSKEYKLSLLREYYSSGMTKYAFEKEHNLAPATFLRWLSAYESEKNCYLCRAEQNSPGSAFSAKPTNEYHLVGNAITKVYSNS
ncbi:MAG: hypothetical protein PUI49_00060, partial [Prevotellaceae bacterium]|nr:hypothetical protein [Prevotellaceae bacterium]MDY5210133.1 hypothetical protein [Prevotella sp.]